MAGFWAHDRIGTPRVGGIIPRFDDPLGVQQQLAGYSLNREHPVGRHKAAVFDAALGIRPGDVPYLAAALIGGLASTPVSRIAENPPWGVLCEAQIVVNGIRTRAGRTAVVVTSWEVATSTARPRLVTAYVKG